MDRKDIASYTRWITSNTTTRELEKADRFIRDLEATQDDGTLITAARAHYLRKGAELVMQFLRGQMQLEEYDSRTAAEGNLDFGAEGILKEELMMEG